MMEGLVTLTVALIVGFGFGLWILYRRMLPELRRETVAGATIAISPRGMATVAVVVGVPKPHRGPEVPLPEAIEPGTAPIDLRKRPDNSA